MPVEVQTPQGSKYPNNGLLLRKLDLVTILGVYIYIVTYVVSLL